MEDSHRNGEGRRAAGGMHRCRYAGYGERIHDLPPVSEGLGEDIVSNLVWVAERDRMIAEHWDVLQVIPQSSKNANTMF